MDDFGLNELINIIIGLLAVGATFRIIFCIIQIMPNPEEADGQKKRIKNTIKFVVIALCITTIKEIIINAYR